MRKVRELFGSSPDGKISTPAKVLGATFLTTVVVSSGLVLGQGGTSFPGGGGGSATANIWETTSGACVRSATLITKATAIANSWTCGSPDAANDICQGGDIVRIASGVTLGSSPTGVTSITGGNSRTTRCVMKGENDGDPIPVTGNLYLSSAISDFSLYKPVWNNVGIPTGEGARSPYDENAMLLIETTGNDITVYDGEPASINFFECGNNCRLEGGDVGPCHYDQPPSVGVCTPKISTGETGTVVWTLKNTAVHGQVAIENTYEDCDSDSCHTVGLAMFAGGDTILDGVKFYDNETTNIRIQACCGPPLGAIKIQNSSFGRVWNTFDGSVSSGINPQGTAITYDHGYANMELYFNTFEDEAWPQCDGDDIAPFEPYNPQCGTSASPNKWYGNIYSHIQAYCNYDFIDPEYNAVSERGTGGSADCGTDRYNATHPPLVSTSFPIDYHRTSDSDNAANFVDSSICALVPLDMDGDSRTGGSTCDAGADQKN